MTTLSGLLRLPREIRDNIYKKLVATDQATALPLTPEQRAGLTKTTSSLGLLSTCHQLRGEFLEFFVDHRQHVFSDPFTFANEYLVTIGNSRRIQSLRHLALSWPLSKKPCTACLSTTWGPHNHADVAEYTTVSSQIRNLATVFKTYPELTENVETITLKLPVIRDSSPAFAAYNEEVFEQVLCFLEATDAQAHKLGCPRRYWMIQTDAAGAGHEKSSTEMLIWALTREIWDRLPDGQMVRDVTCRQCSGSVWYTFHDEQWIQPENCKEHEAPIFVDDMWGFHQARFPDKNWKFACHILNPRCTDAWSAVLSKHTSKTSKWK